VSIDWGEVTALATTFSGLVVLVSVLLILAQLRQQGKEEFVTATAGTFRIWMDDDFQQALQWMLYSLSEQSWREFVQNHRGKYGERAFNRVGAFYNRVGYLVTHHMLGEEDQLLLDTIAGSAIAVWQKIEPLVMDARLMENSTLFQDFENMLPECYECYVPTQPPRRRSQRGASAEARSDDRLH
jgi:hypothetical protein